MSDIDDAKEFVEVSGKFDSNSVRCSEDSLFDRLESMNDEERRIKPGRVSQYSLYGDGYTATTSTIKSLPAGSYDIKTDNKCTYVVPSLPPSGLLLELPEMRSEEVIKVVENFWDSEKDYKEGNEFVIGGATFKAGIMLWGPAGSGKSSVLKLVSKKLIERDGIVLFSSGHPGSTMSFLDDLARVENNRKLIVILEDLDSLIQSYGESNYLEMLDSAKSVDNVLFIATTNYPERLDSRIYNRPGRLSHIIKIGLPGPKTREAYLKAILKNHRDVDVIVEKTGGFTIDHLTALVNSCYRQKKELHSEIERLRTLFRVPKSDSESSMGILGEKQD